METRYMITASCYPPYSRKAWKGQRLLLRDALSDCPVTWVAEDNFGAGLSEEEAREAMNGMCPGVVSYEVRPLETETDLRDPITRDSCRGKVIREERFEAPEAKAPDVSLRLVLERRREERTVPQRPVPAGRPERERRQDRIYGIAGLTAALGMSRSTAFRKAGLFDRALVGREGRLKIYDRELAMRIAGLHFRRRKADTAAPQGIVDGPLVGPKAVAEFLGIAESTVRGNVRMFASAVTVNSRRPDDRVWSRRKVRGIWDTHVAAVHENRRRITTETRWDKVAPPEKGLIRGYRTAARFIHADCRTFMRRQELFAPALVTVKNGVRFYDPEALKTIWTERLKENRRNLSEKARTEYERRRPAFLPEGTVLGNGALARALGIHLNTVCQHVSEFAPARVGRYGREWLWDVARAAEIRDAIWRRNEEIRLAGIAECKERRRLGLEPLRRKTRRLKR